MKVISNKKTIIIPIVYSSSISESKFKFSFAIKKAGNAIKYKRKKSLINNVFRELLFIKYFVISLLIITVNIII